jgi:hypothetical protein
VTEKNSRKTYASSRGDPRGRCNEKSSTLIRKNPDRASSTPEGVSFTSSILEQIRRTGAKLFQGIVDHGDDERIAGKLGSHFHLADGDPE